MDLSTWSRTWSSLFKRKAIEVDCASTPAETPELYLKLALQCLEQADRISSPRKFNEEQCKYLVDKLRVAVMSTSSIIEQIETEFLSLALPEDKARLLDIFKLLHTMGKEVEDFIHSCCQESWIQSAIMLTNMSEHVASIGFNLEFCMIIFSARKLGKTTSLRLSEVACVREAEAEIVKEMANLDEMNLIMDLSAITQSNGSSSADYQLASFLLGRLEMVRLRPGATLPTSNNKCHLQMNLSLKQTQVKLGKGASASVHKAKWLGVEVAKKTFCGPENGDFLQEVSILEGLSHPNIVSLLWYMTEERRCHLVMELMDGDLQSVMHQRMEEHGDQSPPFCIPEALDLMLQVGEGMYFLHEKRIVHRDLKSQNILIKYGHATKANLKYLHVKVADFGLSKTKEHSAYANMTLNVGTTRWMAPEVMKITSDDGLARKVELKYPFKSDVYSFAMVCYEILTGDVPFSALSLISEVKSLVLRGGRPQLPLECPDRLRTLIKACWSAEAVTRPSFGDVCEELRSMKYGNLMTYWIENIPQCSGASGATTARLVANLSNSRGDVQQIAAYGICLRARKSVDHRTCIANEGAIPLLVALLLSSDQRTQEIALSALLELSIDDCNKRQIISAGAIDPIVEVLMSGSVAAQDNAAEMLFFLSLVDGNKITIGNSGAIRALVQLEACQAARTKFDAAIAILSLCIFEGNKARAVEAEVSPLLLSVIEVDPATLVGAALNILGDQSTSQIQEQYECATLVLLTFCSHDPGYIKQVKESNAIEPLTVLTHSRNLSARFKWKASALLELLKKPQVDVLSHRVEGLQM